MTRPKTIILIILGILIISLVFLKVVGKNHLPGSQNTPSPSTENSSNQQPKIVATDPSPLKESTILPTQIIKITFDQRLVNGPETKIKIEPDANFKVDISDDHKTALIIPVEPYSLGQGYTLFLNSSTKFEDSKTLGIDETFSFRTIEYKGV